jgi:hypothetical protein
VSCRNPSTQTDQETENEYTCPRNGLNESWHAHTEPPPNPLPLGLKWRREGMAKRQRSRHQTTQHQKKSKPLSTLQRLEADILDLKEKIKLKEIAAEGDTRGRRNHTDSEGWTLAHRNKALDRKS